MELEALQAIADNIDRAGARLIAVSPQRREHIRHMVKKHNLTFPVLFDEGNRVAGQFGIVFTLPPYLKDLYLGFGIDLSRFNGDDSWTLPIPARFIIDTSGVIRSVHADPDYTVRPEPDDILRILHEMH